MEFFVAFLLVELLCVIGVLADYFLKIAGSGQSFIEYRPFIFGFFFHASTAFGWFLVLKYMRFVEVGAFYSVSMVLMLTAIGVYQFNEELHPREILGILLAVTSLLLLARFS